MNTDYCCAPMVEGTLYPLSAVKKLVLVAVDNYL